MSLTITGHFHFCTFQRVQVLQGGYNLKHHWFLLLQLPPRYCKYGSIETHVSADQVRVSTDQIQVAGVGCPLWDAPIGHHSLLCLRCMYWIFLHGYYYGCTIAFVWRHLFWPIGLILWKPLRGCSPTSPGGSKVTYVVKRTERETAWEWGYSRGLKGLYLSTC